MAEYKVVCNHWCEDKSDCPLWNTPGCKCFAVIEAASAEEARKRAVGIYRQAHRWYDVERNVGCCLGAERNKSGRLDGPTLIHPKEVRDV